MSAYERYQTAATKLNNEAGWLPQCYIKAGKQTQFLPCAKADVYIKAMYTNAHPSIVTQEAAATDCICHGGAFSFQQMIAYEFAVEVQP
jgi:hypothetical protein